MGLGSGFNLPIQLELEIRKKIGIEKSPPFLRASPEPSGRGFRGGYAKGISLEEQNFVQISELNLSSTSPNPS
jgi:hypothetical protein